MNDSCYSTLEHLLDLLPQVLLGQSNRNTVVFFTPSRRALFSPYMCLHHRIDIILVDLSSCQPCTRVTGQLFNIYFFDGKLGPCLFFKNGEYFVLSDKEVVDTDGLVLEGRRVGQDGSNSASNAVNGGRVYLGVSTAVNGGLPVRDVEAEELGGQPCVNCWSASVCPNWEKGSPQSKKGPLETRVYSRIPCSAFSSRYAFTFRLAWKTPCSRPGELCKSLDKE
jgi:hypothetical protein